MSFHQAVLRFCLVLSLCHSAAAVASTETSRYYQINVAGNTIGYIEWFPPTTSQYQGRPATIRNTITVLKSQAEGKVVWQNIVEKTLYQATPYQTLFYSLEYQTTARWEEQTFSFESNKVVVSFRRNGRQLQEVAVPLRPGVHIITDYFSILPLLNRRESHPVALFILDSKRISPESSVGPVEKVTVQPTGERIITLAGKEHPAKTFLAKWENKEGMNFWVAQKDETLLQLEEPGSKTTISLTDEGIKRRLLAKEEIRLPRVERAFPFAPERPYRYLCYHEGNLLGSITWQVHQVETPQRGHKIVAEGKIQSGRGSYQFRSETLYGEDWKPVSYHLKEDKTEIRCEFVARGVKEYFHYHQNILERFVPIPGDYLFTDNNGIHHFAVFLAHFPLTVGTQTAVSLFHPRRMDFTEGVLHTRQKTKDNFTVVLTTPYYTLEMLVSSQGKLIRYVQGKLEVVLEKEQSD